MALGTGQACVGCGGLEAPRSMVRQSARFRARAI